MLPPDPIPSSAVLDGALRAFTETAERLITPVLAKIAGVEVALTVLIDYYDQNGGSTKPAIAEHLRRTGENLPSGSHAEVQATLKRIALTLSPAPRSS